MTPQLPWEDSAVRTAAAESIVHVSRTYSAPREAVYDAWTKPELLTQWFRPAGGVSSAELDVRPGGKYRITVDPQGQLPGPVHIVGTYLEVEPPERLVFSFGWEVPPVEELQGVDAFPDSDDLGDRLDDLRELDSQVTVQFIERDGSTEVAITHERIGGQGLRAFHIFGWESVLGRLSDIL
jgi:uncharacterized protein YndB with AHSA1/START domain